jgi:hypothetical protein
MSAACIKTALIAISAFAALVTGLKGAWEWRESSKIDPEFGYTYPGMPPGATYVRHGIEMPRGPEPVEEGPKRMNEIDAI